MSLELRSDESIEEEYYKVNVPKFSIGELWRANRKVLAFVFLLYMKLMRINPAPHFGIGLKDELATLADLPEDAERALTPLIEQCRQLGFVDGYVSREISLGKREAWTVCMVAGDRQTIAMLAHVVNWDGLVKNEHLVPLWMSEISNGSIVQTTNFEQYFKLRHPLDQLVVKTDDFAVVYQKHRDRMTSAGSPRLITDVRSTAEHCSDVIVRQLIERQALVPLTEQERQTIEGLDASIGLTSTAAADASESTLPDGDLEDDDSIAITDQQTVSDETPAIHPEDAQVLRQIQVQQNQTTSWVTKFALLAISLGAFVGLGVLAWDMELLLLLIPVLFFHELGHYVAMRVLKYRNVKMFFLPLLGAAVHGRSYNAPGWQRAVVALAGPIPGILVACVLGLSIPMDQFWLKVVLLTLFLNALNLLPFLPLDGGWVVQSTLFARNVYLDFIFRVVATAVLAVAGLMIGDGILIFIGVFMAIGLPMAWRMCRMTAGMKRDGWKPAPNDKNELCPDTLHEIVKRLRTKTTAPAEQRGNTALGIYESLASKPPGFFLSCLLLAVHAIALFGSVAFGFWILSEARGRVGADDPSVPPPTIPVSAVQIEDAIVPPAVRPNLSGSLCIHCQSEREAEAARLELATFPDTWVTRIGHSLIVEFVDELDPGALEIARTYDPMMFKGEPDGVIAIELAYSIKEDVDKQEPSANRQAVEDLKHYLEICHFKVSPPWATGGLTDQNRKARSTWYELTQISYAAEDSEELDELYEKMQRQIRKQNAEAIREISKQIQRKINNELRHRIDEYQKANDVDDTLCKLFLSEPMRFGMGEFDSDEIDARMQEWEAFVIETLGAITDPEAMAFDTTLADGYVEDVSSRANLGGRSRIFLQGVSFQRTATGFSALVKWLEENGAEEIQYSIYNRLELLNWNGMPNEPE